MCPKLNTYDGGINIKDESLGIDWRIPVDKAILSEKDLKHAILIIFIVQKLSVFNSNFFR